MRRSATKPPPRHSQSQLTINAPGDRCDREADRAAAKVMLGRQPSAPTSTPAGVAPVAAMPLVHEVIASPGQPLDAGTRRFMESRFRHDFSQVRIHDDGKAAESARLLNALAFTVGSEVVFGAGQHRPHTTAGRGLLAHELAHTLQQSNAGPAHPAVIQRAVQINTPYAKIDDYDPGVTRRRGDPAFGRTIPILNARDQAPRLDRDRFQGALNQPTLAQRDLGKIPRPDLSDPALDPVRANAAPVEHKQRGRRVQLVQEALVALGRGLDEPVQVLPGFGADSIFGDETLAAVKRFQQSASLAVDGIVGPLTLGALERQLATLHGSIFTLDKVGNNVCAGVIHVPPPAASWTSLLATRDFVIDRVIGLRNTAIQGELARHFAQCPPADAVRVFFVDRTGNLPSLVLTHERVHQDEQEATLKKHLVPWDAALEALRLSGRRVRAPNAEEATRQLFAGASLKSPCEVATDIVQEWIEDNARFHSTLAGTPPAEVVQDKQCTTVTLAFRPATSTNEVTPTARPPCPASTPSLVVSREIPV